MASKQQSSFIISHGFCESNLDGREEKSRLFHNVLVLSGNTQGLGAGVIWSLTHSHTPSCGVPLWPAFPSTWYLGSKGKDSNRELSRTHTALMTLSWRLAASFLLPLMDWGRIKGPSKSHRQVTDPHLPVEGCLCHVIRRMFGIRTHLCSYLWEV